MTPAKAPVSQDGPATSAAPGRRGAGHVRGLGERREEAAAQGPGFLLAHDGLMVIGCQWPAQAGYPDVAATEKGIWKPYGGIAETPRWYLRNPGGVFRKVKILQVGPSVLWLALGGVDSGHSRRQSCVLELAAGQEPCVRTVGPRRARGMMSHVLAGGQDHLGVICGSHW